MHTRLAVAASTLAALLLTAPAFAAAPVDCSKGAIPAGPAIIPLK